MAPRLLAQSVRPEHIGEFVGVCHWDRPPSKIRSPSHTRSESVSCVNGETQPVARPHCPAAKRMGTTAAPTTSDERPPVAHVACRFGPSLMKIHKLSRTMVMARCKAYEIQGPDPPRQLAHSGVCAIPPARSRSTASHTRCARSIKAKGLETVQDPRMALRREPRRQETTEFGCVVERQHASALGIRIRMDDDESLIGSRRGQGAVDAHCSCCALSSTVVLRFRGRGPFRIRYQGAHARGLPHLCARLEAQSPSTALPLLVRCWTPSRVTASTMGSNRSSGSRATGRRDGIPDAVAKGSVVDMVSADRSPARKCHPARRSAVGRPRACSS